MSVTITRRDIDEAFASAREAMTRTKRVSSYGEAIVGSAVGGLEVGAGAFANGFVTGRFGHVKLAGTPVPLDLVIGVGGKLLALMGAAGAYGEHADNLANGWLAGYFTKLGVSMGNRYRTAAGKPPISISGLPQVMAGSNDAPAVGAKTPATEAELTSLAMAVR